MRQSNIRLNIGSCIVGEKRITIHGLKKSKFWHFHVLSKLSQSVLVYLVPSANTKTKCCWYEFKVKALQWKMHTKTDSAKVLILFEVGSLKH